MNAVVDTSFLVALLGGGDVHHAEARRLYEQEGPQWVNQPVLTETLQVVHFRTRRDEGNRAAHRAARRALSVLLDDLRYWPSAMQDEEEAIRIFETWTELSFVDACAITDAVLFGGELRTFDERQRRVLEAERAPDAG